MNAAEAQVQDATDVRASPRAGTTEARRGNGLLALVAARAERWLLEPAPPRPRAADPLPEARPVIAVIGLGSRCGSTTIARALAVELARRGRSSAAIVS